MRLLVLEHEPEAPPGLLREWIEARGHSLELAPVPRLRQWPDPRDYDAVVSLGSDASVHGSRHPWIGQELEFLAASHASGTPLLGICFGAQALARALGGEVGPAARADIGWREIETDVPSLITSGPWVRWHYDCFSPPPGAQVLARADGEADAFASGRSLGVQFHPEADGEITEQWIKDDEAKLVGLGVDLARLRAQVVGCAPRARARAFDLFDRIAAWWAQG